eukprot:SAG31_NODE_1846_length_7103_cov_82.594946_6_plen_193_part_00
MNDAPGRRHQQLLTLFTSHPDRLALSLESPQRLRSSDGTLSSFEWPFSVSFGGLVAVERGHGLGEDGAADEATNGLFSLPQLLVDLDVSPPVNEPATVCVLLTCPDPSLYVGFKLVVDRGRKPGMLQVTIFSASPNANVNCPSNAMICCLLEIHSDCHQKIGGFGKRSNRSPNHSVHWRLFAPSNLQQKRPF